LLGAAKQAKAYLKAIPKHGQNIFPRPLYMAMKMRFKLRELICTWRLSEIGSGKITICNEAIWGQYRPKEVQYKLDTYSRKDKDYYFVAHSGQLIDALRGTSKENVCVHFWLLGGGDILRMRAGRYEMFTMKCVQGKVTSEEDDESKVK
jgi:hypothetical protein